MKKKLNTYIDRISKNIYISKPKYIYIYTKTMIMNHSCCMCPILNKEIINSYI